MTVDWDDIQALRNPTTKEIIVSFAADGAGNGEFGSFNQSDMDPGNAGLPPGPEVIEPDDPTPPPTPFDGNPADDDAPDDFAPGVACEPHACDSFVAYLNAWGGGSSYWTGLFQVFANINLPPIADRPFDSVSRLWSWTGDDISTDQWGNNSRVFSHWNSDTQQPIGSAGRMILPPGIGDNVLDAGETVPRGFILTNQDQNGSMCIDATRQLWVYSGLSTAADYIFDAPQLSTGDYQRQVGGPATLRVADDNGVSWPETISDEATLLADRVTGPNGIYTFIQEWYQGFVLWWNPDDILVDSQLEYSIGMRGGSAIPDVRALDWPSLPIIELEDETGNTTSATMFLPVAEMPTLRVQDGRYDSYGSNILQNQQPARRGYHMLYRRAIWTIEQTEQFNSLDGTFTDRLRLAVRFENLARCPAGLGFTAESPEVETIFESTRAPGSRNIRKFAGFAKVQGAYLQQGQATPSYWKRPFSNSGLGGLTGSAVTNGLVRPYYKTQGWGQWPMSGQSIQVAAIEQQFTDYEQPDYCVRIP